MKEVLGRDHPEDNDNRGGINREYAKRIPANLRKRRRSKPTATKPKPTPKPATVPAEPQSIEQEQRNGLTYLEWAREAAHGPAPGGYDKRPMRIQYLGPQRFQELRTAWKRGRPPSEFAHFFRPKTIVQQTAIVPPEEVQAFDPADEAAGKWANGLAEKGVAWDAIRLKLDKKSKKWPRYETSNGVKLFVIRWRKKHEMPPFAKRRSGRPKGK